MNIAPLIVHHTPYIDRHLVMLVSPQRVNALRVHIHVRQSAVRANGVSSDHSPLGLCGQYESGVMMCLSSTLPAAPADALRSTPRAPCVGHNRGENQRYVGYIVIW